MIKRFKFASKKKNKRKVMSEVAVGVAAGTAIGAVSGVLFAPKSGKETRNDIACKVGNAKSIVAGKASNINLATRSKLNVLRCNLPR